MVLMHKALKYLKVKLQANTSSIETNLGRENYRYLGLVLMNTEYATILNTQLFIALYYPNPLAIPSIEWLLMPCN